jgi:MFS family permease
MDRRPLQPPRWNLARCHHVDAGHLQKAARNHREFGSLFGVLQCVMGIGGAIGPAIGGLVLDLGGSRRLLAVPMAIGLVIAIAVLLDTRLPTRRSREFRSAPVVECRRAESEGPQSSRGAPTFRGVGQLAPEPLAATGHGGTTSSSEITKSADPSRGLYGCPRICVTTVTSWAPSP